jgi:hypothetical protein
MTKLFKESTATYTDRDRELEQAINSRVDRGKVACYSRRDPPAFGMVYSWKGKNHMVEQDQPFDADEVVAKAQQWADTMENAGSPRGWSRTP